jgi:hypothetical protein
MTFPVCCEVFNFFAAKIAAAYADQHDGECNVWLNLCGRVQTPILLPTIKSLVANKTETTHSLSEKFVADRGRALLAPAGSKCPRVYTFVQVSSSRAPTWLLSRMK